LTFYKFYTYILFKRYIDKKRKKLDRKKLGKNIRDRREELNLTQQELAKKLGYNNNVFVSRVENAKDNISVKKLENFSIALDCKTIDLIPDEENKKINLSNDLDYLNNLNKINKVDSSKGGLELFINNDGKIIFDNDSITQGLKDLLTDKKILFMNNITLAEVNWLKSIQLNPLQEPTKEDYLDLLYIYRNIHLKE